MARKSRIEIEGGLYHVITRGNNRQQIFNGDDDYQKFLSLLEVQKGRLPFFLYAYCLMTNHLHLLIERQADSIGRIMHRVLTGIVNTITVVIDEWDICSRAGIRPFFVRVIAICAS